jgi:hypothetical protein
LAALVTGCGPTSKALPGFSGKGVVAQTYPYTIWGGQFGRELSGQTEINNIHALESTTEHAPAGWYYNYNPTTDISTTEQFVPMIFDQSYFTAPNLAAAAAYGSAILGFNEPDLASQANMTVAQALTDWPAFEATGAYLVSPACATDMTVNGNWFQRFATGDGGSYVPTFSAIATHLYTAAFTDVTGVTLMNYLVALHNKWGKPIWLTEFGMIGFPGLDPATWTYPTAAQAQAFVTNVIPQLRAYGWINRFSWYPDCASAAAIAANPGIANVALSNPDGSLTTLGALYASL